MSEEKQTVTPEVNARLQCYVHVARRTITNVLTRAILSGHNYHHSCINVNINAFSSFVCFFVKGLSKTLHGSVINTHDVLSL